LSGARRIWSAEHAVRKPAMVTRKSPPPNSLRLEPEVAHASLQRTTRGKVRRRLELGREREREGAAMGSKVRG